MSRYREDADIKAEYPDLAPELVRRAEFFGYSGDTIRACKILNELQASPTLYGDIETWWHDFGKGRIFTWAKRGADAPHGTGALWQVVPLPNGDLLMAFRDATENVLYPRLDYARLSELDSLAWHAQDEVEQMEDLGLKDGSMYAWEMGTKNVSAKSMARITAYLDVSERWLREGK